MSSRCFLPLVLACAPAWAQSWQSLENHPRPDLARPWLNLDGTWRFDFDPEDRGLKEEWFQSHTFTKEIKVPFCWQSALSGIQDTEYNGVAWYERDVTIPADAGPRVFLVFGAIDWSATVWVDDKEVASHEGGYVPFDVEITDVAKSGQTVKLTVRAVDSTDPDLPTGKQVGWYTRTGGIWQTVYLESRGASYIEQAHVYPDIDRQQATFKIMVAASEPGKYAVAISASHEEQAPSQIQDATLTAGDNLVTVELPVPNPALWSPDFPALYDAEIRLMRGGEAVDTVRTYFGMRRISRGTYAGSAQEYILLNDRPIYLRGALHQSFNPEGIYTHPDDDFIRRDYEKAKAYGLNCLRIHIKTEEPRALYWADKLGVMLMCDVPNYWKKSERANGAWEATLRAQIARDFNHPGIIAWVDFNETWGVGDRGYDRAAQEWVRDMWNLTKELDPTRLAEDNSPCNYDHTVTDINSWHFYIDDFERARDHIANVVEKTYPGSQFNYAEGWQQDTAPLMNSEYGGVSAGSGDRDISWVFLFLTNLLRKYEKINGYIYTELSDIEWEHNGFMNYDRTDKIYNYPADITVADLQGAEFPVLDYPPYQQVKAGDSVRIPVLLSHWSDREGLKLRFSVEGRTVDGQPWNERIPAVELAINAAPYKVSPQGSFDFTVPDGIGLISAVVEVLDEGERVGANYCVVHAVDGAAWVDPGQYAVSFPVDAYSNVQFSDSSLTRSPQKGKVYGFKDGFVEYQIQLPKDLKPQAIAGCRLVAEVGAKADRELLDWPARSNPQDYPQSDPRVWPSDVTISVDGIPLPTVTIASDFADAKGVLSHVARVHHGSYGKIVDLPIEGKGLAALKRAVSQNKPIAVRFEVASDAENVGGLALYGATMGQWPSDPTLVFTLTPGTPEPTEEAKPINTLAERFVSLVDPGPKGHVWRYMVDDPGDGWQGPEFDDKTWEIGRAGFGTADTPGARMGTEWRTPDIWLRTTVDIPKGFDAASVVLSLHHDEDVEVYINGKPLLERKGYVREYERIPISKAQQALFKAGKTNTIAMHCHQTGGGQFVDLGISMAAKD